MNKYIYIYIYIGRERDINIYTYKNIKKTYKYINIYI